MDAFEDLVRIHDRLWDPAAAMVVLPPGTNPRVDLSRLRLHVTRETVLGAFLDLESGRTDRAVAAIRSVLPLQYRAPGRPWDGTFRVTAEEPEPPGDQAEEWFHYDPNWRQFIGTALALVVWRHGEDLPPGLVAGVRSALRRCVDGEPPDRIPAWYTNPRLLHAWLSAHVGRTQGDDALVVAGTGLARSAVDRYQRLGDVDEYNSPTYDGVDLLAAALWVACPPTPDFARWGRVLLDGLATRMAALFHPALGAVCGPYLRAYGCDLAGHVGLAGLWWHAVAGADRVLPAVLDEHTDHVHDLYFLPVVRRLADLAGVALDPRPVTVGRRHVQAFDGVVATSVLSPRACIGAEHGRRPAFSADQYVPAVVHTVGPDGSAASAALLFGDHTVGVDAVVVGTTGVDATVTGTGDAADVVLVTTLRPDLGGSGAVAGGVELWWREQVSAVPVGGPPWALRLVGPAPGFTVSLRVAGPPV